VVVIFAAPTGCKSNRAQHCADGCTEYSLALGDDFRIQHGLNISLGIRFDGADKDTHALESSGVVIEI